MTHECLGGLELLAFLNQYNFVYELANPTTLFATAEGGMGQRFMWIYDQLMNMWCIQQSG